jgi:hypothetical protein
MLWKLHDSQHLSRLPTSHHHNVSRTKHLGLFIQYAEFSKSIIVVVRIRRLPSIDNKAGFVVSDMA